MSKRGFTYVELLAVLIIVMLVVSLVSDNFTQGLKMWITASKVSEMRQYLRYNMQTLCDGIRFATKVNNVISSSSTPIVDEVAFNNSTNNQLEVTTTDDTVTKYEITSENILLSNSQSLGGPIAEITIRRVKIYSFGSLYEVTLATEALEFETVPAMELKQLVYAPNVSVSAPDDDDNDDDDDDDEEDDDD